MQAAEVVVIGAGVIGASVAYHLAARGCRDILVLERSHAPGQGSTGRATGGFRAQFGSEVNVHLSLLARDKLLRFRDELGVDPGYRPCGYLFVARTEAELAALRAAQHVQKACGLTEVQAVTEADIHVLNPALRSDTLAGGVFCPSDGFIQPLQILRGYVQNAIRLGVSFMYGAHCVGFRLDRERRITAVRTTKGDVAAGLVVNATGAWAGPVAQQAGIPIPVSPLRRQVATTYPCDLLPPAMPMTIFVEDGFHLRVRDRRVLLLWPDAPQVSDPFDTTVDGMWLAEVERRAHERVPCLKQVALDRAACWAGLYEMSPDKHALLGRAPGLHNFYLVNGSSGHGVMHAPALGQLVAEIVLDGGASTVDVHALRPTRFAEGQPNLGTALL